jgi:hypothetical protein
MSDGWPDVLDAFERRIELQRAALDAGDAGDVPAFEPPARLGPLPPELEARAKHLLTQAKDVEAELAGALQHIAQDLQVVRTISASAGRSSGARFIDTSA